MGSSSADLEETAQQKAFDTEQRKALNDETIEENRRRKALSRGQLGSVSLLSGLPGYTDPIEETETTPTERNVAPINANPRMNTTTSTTKEISPTSSTSAATVDIQNGGTSAATPGVQTGSARKLTTKKKSKVGTA